MGWRFRRVQGVPFRLDRRTDRICGICIIALEKSAMDFLESALRSALLKDGAHLLEDLLNDPRYKGQEQEARPGEKCCRDRAKTVETLFGEVRLLRDYYVAQDGSSRVPLDDI